MKFFSAFGNNFDTFNLLTPRQFKYINTTYPACHRQSDYPDHPSLDFISGSTDSHPSVKMARTRSATAKSAAVSSTGSQQAVLPFLRLPPEIRNIIYKEILIQPGCGCARSHPIKPLPLFTLAQPPLTRVNRQIRQECLPVYYGSNTFSVFVRPRKVYRHGVNERALARFFDSFLLSRHAVPRECGLRLIRNIKFSWWPRGFIESSTHSLTEIQVSLGVRNEWRRGTRLVVDDWSNMQAVETAVFGAVRESLRSSRASRNGITFIERALKPFVDTIWLCSSNCPQAVRYVELYTTVEPLTWWTRFRRRRRALD